jgi:hypothetical protein
MEALLKAALRRPGKVFLVPGKLASFRVLFTPSPPPLSIKSPSLQPSSPKKVLVITYDDRATVDHQGKLHFPAHFMKIAHSRAEKYCHRFGYKYLFLTYSRYHVPPYWQKVFLIRDLLETGEYDHIVWLDSDAFPHPHSPSIEEFCGNDLDKYHLIAAQDMNSTGVNAGVWIVRRSEIGLDLMRSWALSYPQDNWKYREGKWLTDGKWAGEDYEQGQLIRLVREDMKSASPLIVIYPRHALNAMSHEEVYKWKPLFCHYMTKLLKDEIERPFIGEKFLDEQIA